MAVRITARDIVRFTEGDCHILARALARLTGWTLAAFDDGLGAPDIHAFVVRPDGRIVDVEGVHDRDAFITRWISWLHLDAGVEPIVAVSEDDFRAEWSFKPTFGRYSVARARKVAAHLAALA